MKSTPERRDLQCLLQAVRDHLVPALLRLGYEPVGFTEEEERSKELRRAFPVGRFRRFGPTGISMIEIQFDKNGNAAFRVNAGRIAAVGQAEPRGAWVHDQDERFELYGGRWLPRWFKPFRLPWEGLSQTRCVAVATRAANLLPVLINAMEERRRSPHVFMFSRRVAPPPSSAGGAR